MYSMKQQKTASSKNVKDKKKRTDKEAGTYRESREWWVEAQGGGGEYGKNRF